MENTPRKPYPSDVTDDEWAFVAPYLTLMTSATSGGPTYSKDCCTWPVR